MNASTLPALPPPPARRHAVAVGLMFLLAGCAGLSGPRTVTLNEAELQRLIGQQFPVERKLLEVLDLRVEPPAVRLLADVNRVATDFSVTATERLFGRSFSGQLALDSALRYDATDQAVRLTQVRVKRLQFDGMAPAMQATVNRLGGLLAEQLLDGVAVHRFKPEDLARAQRQGLQPGAVTVTARGVEITLVPATR